MPVTTPPQVLGVLAHDLRWTIVGLLVPGDLRTGEIVARTGQPPSLVSYHLGRLRDAGLVSARRSARTAEALFICTGNSARSPMAAGWLNHLGAGRVTARSAGVTPAPLHPL